MQPYAHCALTLVASQFIFPNDQASQLLMTGAAIAPDIAIAIQYGISTIKGEEPLENMSKKNIFYSYELTHCLLLWAIFMFFSWPIFIGASCGHIFLDWISHKNEKSGVRIMWPFPWKMKGLGLFDYRTKPGIATPIDIIITSCCIIFLTYFWYF